MATASSNSFREKDIVCGSNAKNSIIWSTEDKLRKPHTKIDRSLARSLTFPFHWLSWGELESRKASLGTAFFLLFNLSKLNSWNISSFSLSHTHTKEQPDALLLHIEIDRANEEKNFHLIHEEQWHKMPATRIKSIFKLCEELWTWDTTQREWTAWARKMLCAADESMRLWQMKAGNMNLIRWKRETVRWETELAMKTHFCSAVFAYFNIFILFSFSHFNWTFSFGFFLSFSSGLPCENFFAKQQQHLFIFLCTKLRLYRRGSSFFFRHNSSVMRRNCGSFISATDAPGILLLSVYFTFHSLFWLDFFSFFGILFHLLRSVRAYSKWLYKDKWIYQKLCVRCVCVCVLELTTCNCIFF